MQPIEEFNLTAWQEPISKEIQGKALKALEHGKVLYFPSLSFSLEQNERSFFSEKGVDPKRKNISFDLQKEKIGGALWQGQELEHLKAMLKRYALYSSHFLKNLLSYYTPHLSIAKTSFRPVEIAGRKSSVRKDDMRLHIDAFPSNPTHGKRLLRLFTNVNPDGKARVWKVGEPFESVANRFATQIRSPLFGSASLLKLLKITKTKRALYDHYMLHMHNRMKEDDLYQQKVTQKEIHFPAGSSWLVFTDQVSHAVLSGKDVLEQTFSLPTTALKDRTTSPLNVLEELLNQPLSMRG